MKQYQVRLRAAEATPVQLWAESAQEACEKAGWLIGDCHVQELPRDEVDLSKKVRYAKEVYGVEGILGVRCWNACACFVAIVAKMGGVNDWAAYVGALPNRGLMLDDCKLVETDPDYSVTEEEVVRYTIRRGGKMRAEEAAAMFGLPVKQYRR